MLMALRRTSSRARRARNCLTIETRPIFFLHVMAFFISVSVFLFYICGPSYYRPSVAVTFFIRKGTIEISARVLLTAVAMTYKTHLYFTEKYQIHSSREPYLDILV